MTVTRVVVPELASLPVFSHASIAGDHVYVAGTLGTRERLDDLVPGGTGPQTTQALSNMARILAAAGGTLADVAKVNVYLTDLSKMGEMNAAYAEFFGGEAPARITIGCASLAFGAAVEIDCIAVVPGAVNISAGG